MSVNHGQPEQQPGRLSIARKIGYVSANTGLSAAGFMIAGPFLLIYYTKVIGLSPFYVGLAMGVGILWDALTDPVMGVLSDRTRARAGRRRPYFIPGALATALSIILIYHPPAFEGDLFKFLYLLVSYLFFSTAFTVISVPHTALGGEMSFDRNERTTIFGFRSLAGTLGIVLGTILPSFIAKSLGAGNDPESIDQIRKATSYVLVVPIMATALWSFLATRGRDVIDEQSMDRARLRERFGIFRQQLSALRNPYFLPLFSSAFMYGIAQTLWITASMYYFQYRLGFSPNEIPPRFMMPFFLSTSLSVPVWIFLTKRVGKKRPAMTALMLWGISTSVFYPLFPAGQVAGPLALALVAGLLAGALWVRLSMIADAVDYDELKVGVNREGLYFGMNELGRTLTRALGVFLTGALLTWAGVEKGAESLPEQAQWRLALMFGPGVGIFQIIAASLMMFTLSDARHRRIQELLVRKRKIRARSVE